MRFKAWLFLTALVGQIVGCTLEGVPSSFDANLDLQDRDGVIYGDNSIVDLNQNDKTPAVGVSLFSRESYKDYRKNSQYTVSEKYFGVDEFSWSSQPSGSYCSGVLINSKMILTAGHCIETPYSCADLKIAFDYVVNGKKNPQARDCKRVLKSVVKVEEKGLDYAIIEMNRAVNFNKIKISANAAKGDKIYSFGDPLGSYKKMSLGRIRDYDDKRGVFITTLDVFEGNSGSPVFSEDGALIGVLSGGESDFTDDGKVKVCDEDKCLGEIVIPIQKILADWNKST